MSRFSVGAGNKGSAITIDLRAFGFSDLESFLLPLSQEPVDPLRKDFRDWFAPYILKPGATSRTIQDIDYLSAFIAIDIDAAGWTISRIKDHMENHAFIAYTTTHSRPDHQRWRVIAFLSRDYTVAEHRAVWNFLNERFDKEVDAATKDAARISYLPAQWIGADNEFHRFDGANLNVDDILKTFELVEAQPVIQSIVELPGERCQPDGTELITARMIEEFVAAKPGGRFYRLLCSAATRHRMSGWSLSAADLCAAAMRVSQTYASHVQRQNPIREAERALAWAATSIQPLSPMERLRSRTLWHLQHHKKENSL